MKKLVASLLPLVVSAFGVVSAGIITQNDTQSLSSCNSSESHDVYYYIPTNDNITIYPDDTYWNTNNAFINKSKSSVEIYRHGVISQCMDWDRMSNFVRGGSINPSPQFSALIFRNEDGCVFNKPNYEKTNNPNAIDAQIHYTIGFNLFAQSSGQGKKQNTGKFYYKDKTSGKFICYPDWKQVTSNSECSQSSAYYWEDVDYHTGECLNYRVFWCGDGLINRPDGSKNYDNGNSNEQCDPNHPDWKNRSDGQSCTSACTIEYETPVCNSEYNNKKVYTTSSDPYLKGTESLCNPGSVRNFQPSGIPLKFTWGCKIGTKTTVGDACKFEQYWCGDGEINGGGNRNNFINGSHYEQCDPNHPDWKNRSDGQSCTSSCTIKYETSTCGSLNSTTAVYNPNYPTGRIKETDSGLCEVGNYVAGSFSYNKDTGEYTWKCKNGDAASATCSAKDLWCGDKKVNGGEQCDPNDPNRQGWEEGTWKTCNQSCQLENVPRVGPVCSSVYNGHTEYTSMTSTPWINSTTPGLCDKGTLVAGSFTYNGEPRNFSWKCTNDGLEVTCTAKQQWCGDGKKNGGEVCDYKDTTTQDGRGDGCSTTCDEKTYDSAKCGSAYHTHSRYLDINSSWIYSTTPGLCDKGTVINFDKHIDGSNHVYTWQCKNGTKVSEQCWADQQWCGDKEVNGNEQCDPNDPNKQGWEEGTWKTCNQSCELKNVTRVDPVCNSTYNGKTKYTTTSALWINEGDSLCSVGRLVSGTFKYSGEPRDFTWACTNDGLVVNCEAHQQWCGDSEINNNETCDPNDPNEVNWGNDGCDQTCKPKNIVSSGCDETFYYTLRQGWQYTFHDTFNANSTTRYLYDFDVDFVEEKDYNRGTNPSFNWTENLVNGVYIEVPAGTSKKVLISSPLYKIFDHPTTRSKNNLYIEYDIKYSNQIYPTKPDNSRLISHKECAYYEISRCGDGKIDTEWEGKEAGDEPEQCDPGSAGTSVLPNGKICNSECKIVDAPSNGITKIVKTLKEKIPVTQTGQVLTWIVEVTAEGGDATDFEVKDYLPKVLKYEGYSVVSNPDNLTVTGPGTPVSSGNNNVYTWNVRGTLMSGHKLRMEIKSTVKTLVQVADDYLNVACVVDDGKEDCDEAKPNPENGKLEIVKTLESGEISKIGDPVVWKIKVTATGGNVTDFIITDKLPDVLSYSGYTVTHKGSVDSITFGGENKQENSVTRNVIGTLNKGDYVEIRLVTKAKKIPTEEYVNVACVKSETNPEICSEVPVGLLKITKTLLTNKYVETGDIVKWEIKVEAIGGNIGIDYIYDDLPRELGFTGYSILHIPSNITLGEAEPQMGGKKRIKWAVSGILNEGDYISLIVETEVLEIPEDEVKNIACVKPANQDEPKCDEAPIKEKPRVWIKKIFTDGSTRKNVKVGDNVSYKISFGNYSGKKSTTITGISIKDFLPKTVSYLSGTIHIETNSTHSTDTQEGDEMIRGFKVVDGVHIEIYDGITLKPGDTWYIILTGKVVSASTDKDNRTNFACIFVNNESIDCDGVHHDITKEEVACNKMEISPTNFDSQGGSAEMSCYSTGGVAESITIDCDNGNSYTKNSVSEFSTECIYSENTTTDKKTYHPKCSVNRQTSPEKCKGTVTVDKKEGNTSCFPAGTKVTMADGSKKNIEDVEIGDTVLSYNTDTNTNEGNVVQQTLVHTDNIHEMYEITVNGSILKVTDVHPFYVKKSLNANNFDWIEAKDLKIGDMLFMSNGSLVKIENINHYNNRETVYNLEVKGNHNYYVDKGYLVHNKTTTCFVAGTKVTMADGTKKNIEDVEIGEKLLGSNGSINTVLGFDRPVLGDRHLWSINGSDYFVSDEHPFKTTQGWKSFNPEMTKQEIDLRTTELKIGDILITDNGLEVVKSVDFIDADYSTQLYNFVLDGDHTYYANNYLVHNKGGCVENCDYDEDSWCHKHQTDPVCLIMNPKCYNINAGNASYELGEYLISYANMYKEDIDGPSDYIYVKEGNKYGNDTISSFENKSCDVGEVAQNSFVCRYIIRQPGEWRGYNASSDSSIVYISPEKPCFTGSKNTTKNLITARGEWQAEEYGEIQTYGRSTSYTFRPSLEVLKVPDAFNNNFSENNLGEYGYQILVTKYLQCMPDENGNGIWKKITNDLDAAPTCQGNFVLTEPYTVQKTPSGNLTASTESLNKFKDITGNGSFNGYMTGITSTDYKANTAIKTAMDKFINKYEKLAVKVNSDKFGSAVVKKVPGKNIYFLSGTAKINGSDSWIKNPFTIVQTKGNTTISGDLTNNMMLLSRGTITFSGDCNSDQRVKGIFYAENGLIRKGVGHNTELDNSVWCDKGGLQVKGVLIGSGLNNLMIRSRSHLEGWFENGKRGPNARNMIMNGASVLIEYSPSVFTRSTMPPGAEEFTTALSIYKN